MGPNELFLFVLLFLALYSGTKIKFWRLLFVLLLVYMMLTHIRFASLFAMVAPILLAGPLSCQFPFLKLESQLKTDPRFFTFMRRLSKTFTYPVYAMAGCIALGYGTLGIQPTLRDSITPEGAVDYMIRNGLTNKIYNAYDFGGYLIFRGIKTFIDGRTDQLFLGGFTNALFNVTETHPKDFLPYLDRYGSSVALVIPDSMEAQELQRSAGWDKVYSDENGELYKKRD
jgi:hypothetical protein